MFMQPQGEEYNDPADSPCQLNALSLGLPAYLSGGVSKLDGGGGGVDQ